MNINRLFQLVCTAVVAAFIVASCGKEKGGDSETVARVSLSSERIICETTEGYITTEGPAQLEYTAYISQGSDWVSFKKSSEVSTATGKVGRPIFYYMKANTTDTDRQAVFDIEYSDGQSFRLRLTQLAYSVSATYDVHTWAELPAYRSNSDYVYKTYYTTLSGEQTKKRNYSICFDTKRRVSHWVAYPMHTCYTLPSVKRQDTWAYDPNEYLPRIEQSQQQHITQTYGTGHARGHMLPSASRYSTVATNDQTFYATNMMPQNNDFNGGVWATLEGKVRDCMTSDTLYVVTGTYFGDGKTITDRLDKTIAVPSHAYKVLLRARSRIPSGKTIADLSASELISIGFWMPNPDVNAKSTATIEGSVMSVAEIEAITGFEYFRMLPASVAAEVKKQKNLKDWSGF